MTAAPSGGLCLARRCGLAAAMLSLPPGAAAAQAPAAALDRCADFGTIEREARLRISLHLAEIDAAATVGDGGALCSAAAELLALYRVMENLSRECAVADAADWAAASLDSSDALAGTCGLR